MGYATATSSDARLERGSRAHGAGWGYEGVIREVRPLPPTAIDVEEVLIGCGHAHASAADAQACEGLPTGPHFPA